MAKMGHANRTAGFRKILRVAGSHFPLLLTGLALITVAVAAVLVFRDNDTSGVVDFYSGCDSDEIGVQLQQGALLTANKHLDLKPIAEQVAAKPDHDKSPTCLYVLTRYYLDESDPVLARQYFDKLQAVYQDNKGYGKSLGDNPLKPGELKKSVEFLENQVENFKQNIYYAPSIN